MTSYSQQVLWTVLPNGYDNSTGNLRFSVHIAPKLQSSSGQPDLLSSWGDWINWPQILAGLSFQVQFDTTDPIEVTPQTSPGAQSAAWEALFSAETPVTPFQFLDLTPRYIESVPVRNIKQFVKKEYQDLIRTFGTAPPTAAVLLNGWFGNDSVGLPSNFGLTPISPVGCGGRAIGGGGGLPSAVAGGGSVDTISEFRNPLDPTPPPPRNISNCIELNLLEGYPGVPGLYQQVQSQLLQSQFHALPPSSPPSIDDFVQLRLFHRPFIPYRDAAGNQIWTPTVPSYDFHSVLAEATNYPYILRLLGLVLDFEVAAPPTAPSRVVVSPSYSPGISNENVTPFTACFFGTNEYGPNQFIAQPSPDPDLAAGALPLDNTSNYEVVEFDHDGAGLKLFNFAGSVFRAIDIMQTDDTPTTYVPPSLRSPGLSVAHVDRAERVYKSLLRSTAIQAESLGGAPILYAEDITQGYYIHAYSPLHGKWHSLAARNGTYTFLNSGATFDFADEAAINLAATSDPRVPLSSPTTPDGTSNDMRIPQTLFHWTGWSLAAPHPGTQLLEDDTVGIPANTPDPSGFQLTTAFTPQPGTLPLMRYGQSYQFRARAVDLAGNSIPFGDPSQSDPHASEPVTFGRFEPVSQPAVLMVAARTEGESVERLVIRSNYNVPSGADDERHIAPPKTAQQMAELHGAFDTALGLDPTGALYNQIVALADGSYADPAVGPVPDPNTPPMEGSPVSFYYPTTSLPLPYLPDVVARGAAFLDLPGTPAGSVFQVPFIPSGQSWPNYVPFRLAVAEGSGAPVYTPNGPNEGLLTVFLPKGVTAPVQISSYLNAADLGQMGQWIWATEGLDQAAIATLQASAVVGQLWALTPFRELVLVHAVRQPLVTAEFSQNFQALKAEFGQTFAALVDTMSWDRKSTSKVHINASWPEFVDAGPGGPPPTLPPAPGSPPVANSGSVAFDAALWRGDQSFLTSPLVAAGSYSSVAVTAIPQAVGDGDSLMLESNGYVQELTVAGNQPAGSISVAVQPFTANYSYPVGGQAPTQVTDPAWNASTLPLFQAHEFHDTKHRQVTYQAEATTAFAEYFFQTSPATLKGIAPTVVAPLGFVPGTVTVGNSSGALPTAQSLFGVSFADARHGWAVGYGGVAFVTRDGGSTWRPLTAGVGTASLSSVSFPGFPTGVVPATNINRGFVTTGNKLRRTVNGGQTWTPVASTPVAFNAIDFVDSLRGWGVGAGGAIYATTNGGTSWSHQTSGVAVTLRGISFFELNPGSLSENTTQGWAVGDGGTVLATTNGGTTWTPSGFPTSDDLYSVSFSDPLNGWVVGAGGVIFNTADGGQTWNPQTSPTTGNLFSVSFADAKSGWATGKGGLVLHTSDGGRNWEPQPAVYSPVEEVTSTTTHAQLLAGSTYTGIGVAALPEPVLAGQIVVIGTGSDAPTTQVATSVPAGSTSLPIQPLTIVAPVPAATPVTISGGDWVENDVTGAVARTSYSTIPSGGQVSVRYLANPITRTGSPVTLDVLSSKRPDAPSVKYVVPTFSWSRSTDNRGIHSTKTGGTLRVYLDRPWWSSGQGELLGVVAWHGPTSANEATPNDMVTPYVTQFGNDPVHASNPVIDSVQVTDFPMAVATQLQTTVAELPTAVRFDSDMAVDVAGHEVGYDPTRDLWYCDIACAVGKTYWPYIRLALCRFQPDSISRNQSPGAYNPLEAVEDDAYISRIVLADFIQVAPDRFATITQSPSSPTQLTINLTGVSYAEVAASQPDSTLPTSGPGVVFASLEQAISGLQSDLAWQPARDVTNQPISVPLVPTWLGPGFTEVQWTGLITVPQTGGPYRLVLEEYELYDTDPLFLPTLGSPAPVTGLRIVHNDIIPLPFTVPPGGGGGSPSLLEISGQAGTLIGSADGGVSWQIEQSGVTQDLNDVTVAGPNLAVAVGLQGVIRTSSDGGHTWAAQPSGTTNTLYGVSFAGANGWIVGQKGTVLFSPNGGVAWTKQLSSSTADLYAVDFVDATHGWVAGKGGAILATSDGGFAGPGTWTAQPSGTTQNLYGITFADDNHGWAVGAGGTIVATANGGTTWQPQSSGTTQQLNGVSFVGTSNGWAVGNGGVVVTTANGGSTWTALNSGTKAALHGVAFFSLTNGVAVGAGGLILVTTNGGQTWSEPLQPTQSLYGMSFASPMQGWGVGAAGMILATTNGGADWTPQTSGTGYLLRGVSFVSTTQGWAAGLNGTILATTDGGRTWTPQVSGTTSALYGLSFVNATTGWAVAPTGKLFQTVDGHTWKSLTATGLTGAIADVAFSTATAGVAVGANGSVFTTATGGTSWVSRSSGTASTLFSVAVEGALVWAVGANGTILASADGGVTWHAQNSGTTATLASVAFSDSLHGWASGPNGLLLVTSNGGTKWTQVVNPTTANLLGVG